MKRPCLSPRFLFRHEPYLIINREGITVNRQILLRKFTASWAEIEEMYCGHTGGLHKSLNILPRNSQQFYARFSSLERMNLGKTKRGGQSKRRVIALPQAYLAQPIEAVLMQTQQQFESEIKHYDVKIEWMSLELLIAASRAAKNAKK